MKSIILVLALFISMGVFASDSIPKKPVKDSAKIETALLSFKDVIDLETYLNKNVLIENKPIVDAVLEFLRKRVQEKAVIYNGKLK